MNSALAGKQLETGKTRIFRRFFFGKRFDNILQSNAHDEVNKVASRTVLRIVCEQEQY